MMLVSKRRILALAVKSSGYKIVLNPFSSHELKVPFEIGRRFR